MPRPRRRSTSEPPTVTQISASPYSQPRWSWAQSRNRGISHHTATPVRRCRHSAQTTTATRRLVAIWGRADQNTEAAAPVRTATAACTVARPGTASTVSATDAVAATPVATATSHSPPTPHTPYRPSCASQSKGNRRSPSAVCENGSAPRMRRWSTIQRPLRRCHHRSLSRAGRIAMASTMNRAPASNIRSTVSRRPTVASLAGSVRWVGSPCPAEMPQGPDSSPEERLDARRTRPRRRHRSRRPDRLQPALPHRQRGPARPRPAGDPAAARDHAGPRRARRRGHGARGLRLPAARRHGEDRRRRHRLRRRQRGAARRLPAPHQGHGAGRPARGQRRHLHRAGQGPVRRGGRRRAGSWWSATRPTPTR